MNGRGRDKGIRDKGQDDGRDGRGKAQLFICATYYLRTTPLIERARKDIL